MTDSDLPEDLPELSAALRGAEPATPAFADAMAAARTRRAKRPGAAVALAAAAVTGAALALVLPGGEGGAGRESLVVTSPSTVPKPTTSALPEPTPSEVPATQTSPLAPTTSAPATASPAVTPAPDLPADQLVRLTVVRDLPVAAPGNQVGVKVTLTNISDRTLYLARDTSCGDAFGDVSAPGLTFASGSDACGIWQGSLLRPGASRSQTASTYIADTATTRSLDITATAVFSLEQQGAQAPITSFDKRLAASVPLQLQDAASGTRTFRLINDTDV